MKIQGINNINQNMVAMQKTQKVNAHPNNNGQANARVNAAKSSTQATAKPAVTKTPAKAKQVNAQTKPAQIQAKKPENNKATHQVQMAAASSVNVSKMQTYNAGGKMKTMKAASELGKGQRVDFRA